MKKRNIVLSIVGKILHVLIIHLINWSGHSQSNIKLCYNIYIYKTNLFLSNSMNNFMMIHNLIWSNFISSMTTSWLVIGQDFWVKYLTFNFINYLRLCFIRCHLLLKFQLISMISNHSNTKAPPRWSLSFFRFIFSSCECSNLRYQKLIKKSV